MMIAINTASRSGTVTSSSIALLIAVQGVLSFGKTNFMCCLPMSGYTLISLTWIAEKKRAGATAWMPFSVTTPTTRIGTI